MQLKIESENGIVFEWIPYNQLSDIKKTGKRDLDKLYSAIWNDGPLTYYDSSKKRYIRKKNKEVALKCIYNSQNITNEFLNMVWNFLI